jgi:hypothetical protein
LLLPTCTSEHTANARNGSSLSCFHSRNDWFNNWIDGTRNNTVVGAVLRLAANSSAIFNAVNVLPVPHAMIS